MSIMDFIHKIEQVSETAARRLSHRALHAAATVYSDAKELADKSAKDVDKAKAKLEDAMKKAYQHADAAHSAAVDAYEKANAEAQRLAQEVEDAAFEAANKLNALINAGLQPIPGKEEKKEEPEPYSRANAVDKDSVSVL